MKPASLAVYIKSKVDLDEAIERKQNEFLDLYSFYCKTGIAWIHDELKLKAYELHLLDPDFKFRSCPPSLIVSKA